MEGNAATETTYYLPEKTRGEMRAPPNEKEGGTYKESLVDRTQTRYGKRNQLLGILGPSGKYQTSFWKV